MATTPDRAPDNLIDNPLDKGQHDDTQADAPVVTNPPHQRDPGDNLITNPLDKPGAGDKLIKNPLD